MVWPGLRFWFMESSSLKARPLTDALLDQIADVVDGQISPISDLRGSEWYKRQMARVFVKRAIRELEKATRELIKEVPMPDYSVVGQPVYRKDSAQKVKGQVLHVGNIEMPGMLHTAVLRSSYPHARIVRIDKSDAEKADGVVAVVTGADIAAMPGVDPYVGPAFRDQPILCVDKVCHVGDPVVAVVAEELRQAEDALQLIDVEYDPLPAVLDVLEAVKADAPLVHEDFRPAKAFADLAHMEASGKSNICYQYKLRNGDVNKAFAEADRIFEHAFSSPPAQHVPMEPHVTLAYVDENERINLWTASQTPSFVAGGNLRHLRHPHEPRPRAHPLPRRRVRSQALCEARTPRYGAGAYHAPARVLCAEPRGRVRHHHQTRRGH